MVRVFINGYGNIGRRIASAFSHDEEIQLVGIAKYSIDERLDEAFAKKFKVYVPEHKMADFRHKGYDISGTISDAIKSSDIVIDAAKDGFGYANKKNFYIPMGKGAIFQGGEDRDGEKKVADLIHNSRINYDKVANQKFVIQGSCNVSGMGRIMQPLIEKFGDKIQRYDVTLIRRSADLEDTKEVKDSIEWDKNPHHQEDVKSFLPSVKLYVEAYKVPSRMMHLHQMTIRFKDKVPYFDSMSEIYHDEFGVAILAKAKGTADIRIKAREFGFKHDDTNMVHIHEETMRKSDDTLKILYSDDQTGIVIPENHLLFQSMIFGRPKSKAYDHTDSLFQISKKREMLEKEFGA
jgi:glyceraldehyde-3-phosphate dehydrogenase (NAD(P)+) (phosphorylating)